jgi:hypothetical protein
MDFFVIGRDVDRQAVTPGQGQTVNVAGVEVGEISSVKLRDGKASSHADQAQVRDRLQGRVVPAAAQDRPARTWWPSSRLAPRRRAASRRGR